MHATQLGAAPPAESRGSAELVNNRNRELVAALVLGVPHMSPHPLRVDGVEEPKTVEFLPELDIEDGALLAAPATLLPPVEPLVQPLHEILRVTHKPNAAGPLQELQPLDRTEEFHAVVRGAGLAARTLALHAVDPKNEAPASWPRVSRACAVRKQFRIERCCSAGSRR